MLPNKSLSNYLSCSLNSCPLRILPPWLLIYQCAFDLGTVQSDQ